MTAQRVESSTDARRVKSATAPTSRTIVSRGPEQTRRLGVRLGELAQPGDLYLLVGDLGAGKTCLVQGIGAGLGVAGPVRSPSFVIATEHRGRLPLYHIDLYRLDATAAAGLGLDDYIFGQGVCAVEWADRALSLFPPPRLVIRMRYLSPRRRELVFEPTGRRYEELVEALAVDG